MKGLAATILLTTFVLTFFGVCAAATGFGVEDLHAGLGGVAKTGGVAVKMDGAVAGVALGEAAGGETGVFAPAALDFVDGKARVVIELEGELEGAALASELGRLGCVVETSYENLVQALVPPERLADVAALPEVRYVRAPLKPCLFSVTSEGVPVINADDLHALGVTGSGVKVAIIDAGFKGYATNPELPASCIAEVKSFRADGDIEAGEVHGTACAEIVHDVAPGAQLYLFNFGTDVEYANAVAYAISKGVDIISASLGWVNAGPYDGTGFICDVANDARAHGILYVNAAGNLAGRHYEGAFTDADADGWHEFATGDETIDLGYLPAGTPVTLFLSWDDWPYSNQDYDLYLLVETPAGLAVAAASEN
ncbi:MAG: S8 family serine peptidase, partial [Candidatus Alkanophagales archaeon]